jgi:hypothetical protein
MKKLIILGLLLTGCNSSEVMQNIPEFDWMPSDLLWQHNVRDCRSQPQCNAADLFDRT